MTAQEQQIQDHLITIRKLQEELSLSKNQAQSRYSTIEELYKKLNFKRFEVLELASKALLNAHSAASYPKSDIFDETSTLVCSLIKQNLNFCFPEDISVHLKSPQTSADQYSSPSREEPPALTDEQLFAELLNQPAESVPKQILTVLLSELRQSKSHKSPPEHSTP